MEEIWGFPRSQAAQVARQACHKAMLLSTFTEQPLPQGNIVQSSPNSHLLLTPQHFTSQDKSTAKGQKAFEAVQVPVDYPHVTRFPMSLPVHPTLIHPAPQTGKERGCQNSLVDQWLGLCPFTAKSQGSILGLGTKIPQDTRCSQKIKGGRGSNTRAQAALSQRVALTPL